MLSLLAAGRRHEAVVMSNHDAAAEAGSSSFRSDAFSGAVQVKAAAVSSLCP